MTDLEKKIEKLLKEQDKYIGWQKDATKAILTLFKEREASWREEVNKALEDNRGETMYGDEDSNEVMKDSIENFIVAVKDQLLRSTKDEPQV